MKPSAKSVNAVIACGEDSRHQFKRDFTNVESLAADKRQVTAREEMQRIFQQAGPLHADEQAVSTANLDNIDQPEFANYFERRYGKPLASIGMPLERLLQNLNLGRNGVPNLTGMLLFGKWPTTSCPLLSSKQLPSMARCYTTVITKTARTLKAL